MATDAALRLVKRILSIALPLIVAALFAVWWFSPEKVVKRRVDSMLSTAEVPSSMSEVGRGARGRNLAKFLDEQVSFRPPEGFEHPFDEFITREGASSTYSAVARLCREITFTDLEFTQVSIEGDTAKVEFRVDTVVELPDRRPIDGILEVTSKWRDHGEGWVLADFSWLESGR